MHGCRCVQSDAAIDKVLSEIGLSHVSDNVIGTILRRGLSGGQKRRVSVAMELVDTPSTPATLGRPCWRARLVLPLRVSPFGVACSCSYCGRTDKVSSAQSRPCAPDPGWQPQTSAFLRSGLDATTALTLMEYMKTLARQSDGKLGVLVTLQQPNQRLLQVFDHISILGHGERDPGFRRQPGG